MEPCLFRHGKEVLDQGSAAFHAASMEPCLFRHGKLKAVEEIRVVSDGCFNGAMSFQTW